MKNSVTLRGLDAIAYAERHGLGLGKDADPIEDAREGLTVEEAREVAREDAGLIYVEVPWATARKQIEALRVEAGEAGDEDAAEDCVDALAGDHGAVGRCMEVICEAIHSAS